MNEKNKIKVYLAGGWFNEKQREVLDTVESLLDKFDNLEVYSPRKKKNQFESGTKPSRKTCESVFEDDVIAINGCDIMIASTESKDMGTVFEMGVAYQTSIPVIAVYFHEEPYNLMLEVSAVGGVARTLDQLNDMLIFIKNSGLDKYLDEEADKYRYQGLIE